jgi:hypothetical protein
MTRDNTKLLTTSRREHYVIQLRQLSRLILRESNRLQLQHAIALRRSLAILDQLPPASYISPTAAARCRRRNHFGPTTI